MIKLFFTLLSISCAMALEMWFNVEGTKFAFDKHFRLNLEKQAKLPNNSAKK